MKDSRSVITVPIGKVKPYYEQARQWFDDECTEALAASIAASGQLTPCLVHQVGRDYQLISGERRLRAMRDFLGLKEIDVIVSSVGDDDDHFVRSLVDNVAREDLSRDDEVTAVARVWGMPRFAHLGVTERKDHVRRLFGRSLRWLESRLALNALHPDARAVFAEQALPADAAPHVATIKDGPRQVAIAQSLVGRRGSDAIEVAKIQAGRGRSPRAPKDQERCAYEGLLDLLERTSAAARGAAAMPMDKVAKALAGKPQRKAQLVDRIASAQASLAEVRAALSGAKP